MEPEKEMADWEEELDDLPVMSKELDFEEEDEEEPDDEDVAEEEEIDWDDEDLG